VRQARVLLLTVGKHRHSAWRSEDHQSTHKQSQQQLAAALSPSVHNHHHHIAHFKSAPQLPPELQPRLVEAEPPLAPRTKARIQVVAPGIKGGCLERVKLLSGLDDALSSGL